jgi:hypothetical protein
MKTRVPDLLVEQLRLGELSPAEADRVRAQLEEDDDPRLESLKASDAEILDAHPPEVMARRIKARLDALEPEAEPGFRWPLWATGGLMAAAAAVALVLLLPTDDPSVVAPPGTTVAINDSGGERIKGDAAIVLERQRGTRAETLLADADVSPGDTLQVSYRSGGWEHGVLVSLDGAGAVTLHFPADETASTQLQKTAVLHAFELDDAPDFERFILFTAHEPLDAAAIVRSMETFAKRPDARSAVVLPAPAEAIVELPLNRVH